MMSIKCRVSLTFGLVMVFSILATSLAFATVIDLSPDTILVNGKVVTVDKGFSIVEAVAIKGDKFVGVGTTQEIRALAGPKTEVIDLGGKTVVPGFFDGHAHMDREGLKFIYPALTETGYLTDPAAKTVEEIVKIVEREVKKRKPGEWVITMPIGDYPYYTEIPDALAKTGFPTRWDLDKVSPDNPVYIRYPWYYWRGKSPLVSVVNSQALKLAGITKDTLPPHAGIQILKDYDTGEPTGVFLEWGGVGSIEFSLMKVAPRFTEEMRTEALKLSMQRYNAVGTTSVYEGHGISSETLRAYKTLWERGEATVRSYLVISPAWDASPEGNIEELLRDWSAYAAGKGIGDTMLKLGGIWTNVGTSPVDSIRRKERPYTAWAGYGGDQDLPPARGSLYDVVLAAAKTNLRANAIGAAVPVIVKQLEVFEQVNEQIPIADRRFVLEHIRGIPDAELEKIKKLGVVITSIAHKMIEGGTRAVQGLSEQEANTYLPLKSLVDHNIPFVLCTDNVPINPLHVFQAAVTRKDSETGEVVVPSQRISREDALRAFTINGAYLTFEEDIKGSIEIGKLADLVVLSDDILTCPEDQIEDAEVVLTMVGGKIVYKKGQ
jgi:predicted amidohydrolase YtcJ